METKGLISGKFGFGLTVCMIFTVLALFIIMILGSAPLVMVKLCGGMNLYTFHIGAFAVTKYHVDEDGVYTESLISRYSKKINWNEINNVEETVLAYTNQGRGSLGEYYVISSVETVEQERGLVEMMKCKGIICIPITKETKACMVYYTQKYQLNIK